jgi:hypothetical protein
VKEEAKNRKAQINRSLDFFLSFSKKSVKHSNNPANIPETIE